MRASGGIVAAALVAAAAAVAFSDVYIVPSASMRPTLEAGDIIWCVPAVGVDRGTIVVFETPETRQPGIKRVVGLPADRVSYVDKQLRVNDALAEKRPKGKLPSTDTADVVLEQTLFHTAFDILELYGESLTETVSDDAVGYFVLGDNRDDSMDSREFGRLPEQAIVCRATAILATERASGFTLRRVRVL